MALHGPLTESLENIGHEYLLQPIFPYISVAEQSHRSRWKLHKHVYYEVVVANRGVYHCTLNGEKISLKKPQALLIKPGDWHEDSCIPPSTYFGFQFRVTLPIRYGNADRNWCFFEENAKPRGQIFNANPLIFVPIIRETIKELKKSDFASQFVVDAHVRNFFWQMLRALNPSLISSPFQQCTVEQTFVIRLRRAFETHQSGHLSVKEIAELMDIGERTLDNRCREIFRESPARCFARFKVE